MIPLRRFTLLCLALLTSVAATCAGPSSNEISRERAIEIARSQLSFSPDTIDATRTDSGGRNVWRVTFRGRLPGQPPGLFETLIVEVDRITGEIIGIART